MLSITAVNRQLKKIHLGGILIYTKEMRCANRLGCFHALMQLAKSGENNLVALLEATNRQKIQAKFKVLLFKLLSVSY